MEQVEYPLFCALPRYFSGKLSSPGSGICALTAGFKCHALMLKDNHRKYGATENFVRHIYVL
ncbi:MAG: hypothetical protein IJD04_07555 [Desulfovibrionaceae bacterium]|nr:hypothetical protein [Desulfovibrionaceae bacterium]